MDDDDDAVDDDDVGPPQGPDLREAGPYAVGGSQDELQTSSGCTLQYDLRAPTDGPVAPLVVLLHGLECGREHVADVAIHYASWGLTVVSPDVCHSTLLDLDQEQNGLDVIELAAAVGTGPVIYAGHSAGGLASFVAAANDPLAVALLGLDPAEWNGIGAAVAPSITVPAYGLIGDPGVCNGWNNGVSLFDVPPVARALRVTEADHCDFSSPNTCLACTTGCGVGTNLQFSDAEVLQTILGLSTGFLLWQTGLDSSGQQWWDPGVPWYDDLLAAGAISEL